MSNAISMGTKYEGFFGVDTSNDAIYAADRYDSIPTYHGNSTRVTNPEVNKYNEYFNNKNIMFFSGHGNTDNMFFKHYNNGSSIRIYADVNRATNDMNGIYNILGKLGTVQLAVYAGCCTARGGDNITKRSANVNDQIAAIGWTTTNLADPASTWLRMFNGQIAAGDSVGDAYIYAQSGCCFLPFSGVRNARLEGNGALILNNIRANEIIERVGSEQKIIPIDENIPFTSVEKNINDIAKQIQKSKPNFNLKQFSTFESHEMSEFDFIIDITQKIGSFETLSGYTVLVKDKKLYEIYDNTIDISNDKINKVLSLKELSDDVVNDEIQKAISNLSNDQKINVTNKIHYYYYDIKEDKTYLMILIEYLAVDEGYEDLQLIKIEYNDIVKH